MRAPSRSEKPQNQFILRMRENHKQFASNWWSFRYAPLRRRGICERTENKLASLKSLREDSIQILLN